MATPPQLSREVAFQFGALPFRTYTDGSFERLDGEVFVPPSVFDPRTGVSSKDITVGTFSARLYLPRPPHTTKLPLLLYFHGGGFCIETPFSPHYHPYLNSLCSTARVLAVSVHYRRAPEHPVDACYDDSYAALQWTMAHAGGTGSEAWLNEHADFSHVCLMGDSAGGNIAHHVAMRAGRGGIPVDGVALIHPYFWGKERLEIDAASDEEVKKGTERLWSVICPESEMGVDDPRVNVVKAGGLAALACRRVLVCVAELDVLRGRGWEYYDELGRSGWRGEVEIWETPSENHVFHLFNPACRNAAVMMDRVASFLNGK